MQPAPGRDLHPGRDFGENDNHWLHVTVEPTSPGVFGFEQRIVTANLVVQ